MKRLVIINGVTGAIGSACLAVFSRDSRNTIYGLSRRGLNFAEFLQEGHMPDSTLVCSVDNIVTGIEPFFDAVNFSLYEEVVYIHAVGMYLFEMDSFGRVRVENDSDSDGINDEVMNLSYHAFFAALQPLVKRSQSVKIFIFAGLADRYEPQVHQSWWKTMKLVKDRATEVCKENQNLAATMLTISSVMCPNELITRPFVFRDTDAQGCFWLMPHEVAFEVERLASSDSAGFYERPLFHPASYFQEDYFTDGPFTVRKQRELGISTESE